jgi:aldose 1-epimerase
VSTQVREATGGAMQDGTDVHRYTLSDRDGMTATVSDYGATLTSLTLPDGTDVILGFDTLDAYVAQRAYIGATVGRYANRIARGRFTLDGVPHELTCNEGTHHLHGGTHGFDRAVWRRAAGTAGSLALEHLSADGDQGYSGALHARVRFALPGDRTLRIDYEATSDRATPVNLTCHAYFNLAGSRDVLGHLLQIPASWFTPVDDELIPTGELRAVAGTALDFRALRPIGLCIADADPQLEIVERLAGRKGYDHNFVLDGGGDGPHRAAYVVEPRSGRSMEILTTQPGVQFYSGQFLDGTHGGRGGARYGPYAGFCLEPQHFPDSPNQAQFPNTVLRPGETYRQSIVYRFDW